MRPRKKANLGPRLAACEALLIREPETKKGMLRQAFPNPDAPLHLEIGCGKGRFIVEQAKQHPEINFLAMEREDNVIISALELAKQQEPALQNVRFLLADASGLPQMVEEEALERICINFCDPWHKHRHFKRRLTWRGNLEVYKRLLKPGGEIHFKTDNYMLYHFSLFEFGAALPFYFKTTDLHNSELAQGNIMTEYETYFSNLGQPIYAIRAKKDK